MRKIIEGKRYDTRTATKLGDWDNGFMVNDFDYMEEALYRTPRGNLFLVGEGGARTGYATHAGNMWCYGRSITPVSREVAVRWCERHGQTETLEQHFPASFVDA